MSPHPDLLQITSLQTAQYTWIVFLHSSHTGIRRWLWEFILVPQPWTAEKEPTSRTCDSKVACSHCTTVINMASWDVASQAC